MLLRIGDTIINTEHIALVTYNGEVRDSNPEFRSGGRTQSIIIHFVGGGNTDYHGLTADLLWQRLSKDLESID